MAEGDNPNNSKFLDAKKLSSSSQPGSSIHPSVLITSRNVVYPDGSIHNGDFIIYLMF
jgi:hypothetical protein